MRLLSLTLLLLSFSPSFSAPLEQQTTIETIVETVTRTVIHEVTDPSDEMEGSGTDEEASVPDQSAAVVPVVASNTSKPCKCKPKTDSDSTTLTDSEKLCKCKPKTDSDSAQSPVVVLVVASNTGKPCKCKPKTGSDSTTLTDSCKACKCKPAPASDISEMTGQTKMCSCDVSSECRKGATEEMETCMSECQSEIKCYGDKMDDYLKCFSNNNATIVESEECLFANNTNSCIDGNDDKFIEKPNWNELTDVSYSSEASKEIKENILWKRDEKKYNTMQKFFHCTKNCIHKKYQECIEEKGCTVRIPENFATKMNGCIKNRTKIASAILKACQCLAWNNGVVELRGSCVIIGSQYFIDRA